MTPTRLSTCAFLFLGAGLVGLSQAEPRLMRDGGEDQAGVVAIKLPLRSPSPRASTGDSRGRKPTTLDLSSPAAPWRATPPVLAALLAPPKEHAFAIAASASPWQAPTQELSEAGWIVPQPLHSAPAAPFILSQSDLTRPAEIERTSRQAKYPDHQKHRFIDIWDFIRGCLRAPDGLEA